MGQKTEAIEVHIPSVLGYEKVAMESAAALARIMGFHKARIEDLKTAVAEACTNAIEHGNRLQKHTMVLVTLKAGKKSLEVNVKDAGRRLPKSNRTPCIEEQVGGKQDPGGWGIFLIKQLMDEVEFKNIPDQGNVTRMVIHVNR